MQAIVLPRIFILPTCDIEFHSKVSDMPDPIQFRLLRNAASVLFGGILGATVLAAPPSTKPVEGLRDNTPAIHALVGATIVTRPGHSLANATLIVRDGVITQVGDDITPPADARVWDVSGKTIYPGFIDAYSTAPDEDYSSAMTAARENGAAHWNRFVTPQVDMSAVYQLNAETNKTFRGQGFTARLFVPTAGILRGKSALVTTADVDATQAILKDAVAQHAELTAQRRSRDTYPNSPMGAVALARQAMYDAKWYSEAWQAYRVGDNVPRPEQNDALEALETVTSGDMPFIIETSDEQYFLRADRFSREFGIRAIIRGSGQEYQRLDAVRNAGRTVIVPLDFPKPPDVASPEAARSVELEELLHWDLAPENPARLEREGVKILLTTNRLKGVGDFLDALRKAVNRGLSQDAAIAALTTTPAETFGVDDKLGTLEAGKAGSFFVTDGNLFTKETRILETWIDGRRYEVADEPELDIRGTWKATFRTDGEEPLEVTINLEGTPKSLKGSITVGENKVELKKVDVRDTLFGMTFSSKEFDHAGVSSVSAVVSTGENQKWSWQGNGLWGDGKSFKVSAERTEPSTGDDESGEDAKDLPDERRALYQPNYPLGAFGRQEPPEQAEVVAFTGATVWTLGSEGILENATVLVRSGKIEAVGSDVDVPSDAQVVDASGKHITPGIIDCHSHIATDGGVNESAQAITAEVRIGDFIDTTDIDIYRQLAGGVTSSNILHGSANPIGGQNQVVKMRWGLLPEEAKFARAPEGIKFALGENVKQSNWGENYTTRYPQTRMGVEQIIRDAFHAAKDYELRWRQWRDRGDGLPPRRDLELEALVEVVNGTRLIHCHSYRQDEILALMRTTQEFGIRIATLQHILEGYKVAEVMAELGVMGSAFSDWWAYKFEVYDAIPYNGSLMHEAGVVVTFNSDDAELARRLNLEAAKATKYGGVPPEEALKFVTLNAAKQLRIEEYVGSLEPGKDADLVVWSGPPMSSYTRCEQTWIDGRRYFDRDQDNEVRRRDHEMRTALIQRILDSGEEMKKDENENEDDEMLWPRTDIFCRAKGLRLIYRMP